MNAPAPGLLRGVRIDGTSKGMPPVSDPVPLLEAGTQGWTLDDLEPPFVVIRRSALEHNVSLMAGYCDEHRVSIAPVLRTFTTCASPVPDASDATSCAAASL